MLQTQPASRSLVHRSEASKGHRLIRAGCALSAGIDEQQQWCRWADLQQLPGNRGLDGDEVLVRYTLIDAVGRFDLIGDDCQITGFQDEAVVLQVEDAVPVVGTAGNIQLIEMAGAAGDADRDVSINRQRVLAEITGALKLTMWARARRGLGRVGES
jgi:hypothetical protein